jgi:hypothetical protein
MQGASETLRIIVTAKPPGRPGGQCGIQLDVFTFGVTTIPEGTQVFCNGNVWIGPGVTLAMLNKKQNITNIHLRGAVSAFNSTISGSIKLK